jgi:hypothetical protein
MRSRFWSVLPEKSDAGFPGVNLLKRGPTKRQAILTISRKGYWRLSKTLAIQTGMTNEWFEQQGLHLDPSRCLLQYLFLPEQRDDLIFLMPYPIQGDRSCLTNQR